MSLDAPSANIVSLNVLDEARDKVGELLSYYDCLEDTVAFRVLSDTAYLSGTVTYWRSDQPILEITEVSGLARASANSLLLEQLLFCQLGLVFNLMRYGFGGRHLSLGEVKLSLRCRPCLGPLPGPLGFNRLAGLIHDYASRADFPLTLTPGAPSHKLCAIDGSNFSEVYGGMFEPISELTGMHRASRAQLILALCLIDHVVWLQRPQDDSEPSNGTEYIRWCARYLRLTSNQALLYAHDIYDLRCTWVHSLGGGAPKAKRNRPPPSNLGVIAHAGRGPVVGLLPTGVKLFAIAELAQAILTAVAECVTHAYANPRLARLIQRRLVDVPREYNLDEL